MAPNLSKTFLAMAASILLAMTCVTVAKMVKVDRDELASQRILPSENSAPIDWAVYREW